MKKNTFFKLHEFGYRIIEEMMQEGKFQEARTVLFLASEMDINLGALNISTNDLAMRLECTQRHAQRVLKYLEYKEVIRKLNRTTVALNPSIAWASKDARKALFHLTDKTGFDKIPTYIHNEAKKEEDELI